MGTVCFELHSFLHVRHEAGWDRPGPVTSNPDLHLIHIVDGQAVVDVGDQRLNVDGRRVLWIPLHVPYRFLRSRVGQTLEMFNFHFDTSIDEVPLSHVLTLPLLFEPPGLPTIQKKLRSWHRGWVSSDPLDRLEIAARLEGLLAGYLRRFAISMPEAGRDPRMLHLRRHIETRADQPFDAREYAKTCCLSTSQMNRRFRAFFGLTPYAFWQSVRLAQLRRLLIENNGSIDQIAAEMNFCDRFHLTRWFTQRTGIPPVMYRRQMSRSRL